MSQSTSTTQTLPDRRSHASSNIAQRERKAEKIRRLLERWQPLGGSSLLEIGAGAGVITRSLARALAPEGAATAVDVVDERVVCDGYRFLLVRDTTLPFEDAAFDVIISNHVIEHVGDRDAQLAHLREIRRVIKPGGLVYLAVPNRWAFIEPHYRLSFLSWLPPSWASHYVRLRRKGDRYDCRPLAAAELRRLVRRAGFLAHDQSAAAIRATLEIEGASGPQRLALRMPPLLLQALGPLLPTLILILQPRGENGQRK